MRPVSKRVEDWRVHEVNCYEGQTPLNKRSMSVMHAPRRARVEFVSPVLPDAAIAWQRRLALPNHLSWLQSARNGSAAAEPRPEVGKKGLLQGWQRGRFVLSRVPERYFGRPPLRRLAGAESEQRSRMPRSTRLLH